MESRDELNNTTQDTNPVEEYVNRLKEEANKKKNSQSQVATPEYLLPQFKTIEQQAKSYKELQALQTKQSQELAKYKQLVNMQNDKSSFKGMLSAIDNRNASEQNKINELYKKEFANLQSALNSGKITKQEANLYAQQLNTFINNKLTDLHSQYKSACEKCGSELNMLSPKDYFQNDISIKNYIAPISEFLETHYKKMTKTELDAVKNLISDFEKSLREEILNEISLNQQNEAYRNNLSSATNLSAQNVGEKIYTLSELKKMKPEEIRKNQKAILEQFTARKIK